MLFTHLTKRQGYNGPTTTLWPQTMINTDRSIAQWMTTIKYLRTMTFCLPIILFTHRLMGQVFSLLTLSYFAQIWYIFCCEKNMIKIVLVLINIWFKYPFHCIFLVNHRLSISMYAYWCNECASYVVCNHESSLLANKKDKIIWVFPIGWKSLSDVIHGYR